MPVKLLEALGEYREQYIRASSWNDEFLYQQMAFGYIRCAHDFNVIDSLQFVTLQTTINEW